MTETTTAPGMTRFAWAATLLLGCAFAALTAGDIATTLAALGSGNAVELNPHAARDGGGIRVGFVVASNCVLLLPLLIAFAIGVGGARRVPATVLARWWRHIADPFYLHPLSDGARQRRPLRLVTAAMTLLALKLFILVSNSLVVLGYPNPTSELAGLWTRAGVEGGARYWAAYALIIVPCYVAGVGFAAGLLRAAQRHA